MRTCCIALVFAIGCAHAATVGSGKGSDAATASPDHRATAVEPEAGRPKGPFRWAQALAGIDNPDVMAVAVDPQGGIVVAGGSNLMGSGGPSAFLRKYASSGALTWSRSFPGQGKVAGVATDRQGAIAAVGSFTGSLRIGDVLLQSNGTRSDIFVARFSPEGNLSWAKSFGGAFYEAATAVAVDATGNLYVTGTYQKDLDFGLGSLNNRLVYDVFVVKFDATGHALWNRGFHANGGTETAGLAIAVDGAGDVLVAGRVQGAADFGRGFTTPHHGDDAFVVRMTADGKTLVGRRFGGDDNVDGRALAVDSNGDVVLVGSFAGTMNFDGGVASIQSAGQTDIFVLALDKTLKFRWVRRLGSTGRDLGRGVVVDGEHRAIVAGSFEGELDFGDRAPVGPGQSDGFVAAFSGHGEPFWAVRIASAGPDEVRAIALGRAGHPVVAGTFGDAIAGAGLAPAGKVNSFVAEVLSNRVPSSKPAETQPAPANSLAVRGEATENSGPGAQSSSEADNLAASACERGDLALLKTLVPARVAVTARRADGWSLLRIAAFRGQAAVIRYLLAHQANPNDQAGAGHTILQQATRGGYLEAVKALVQGGADVNAGDRSKQGTALHVAIAEARGDRELVRFLLSRGAKTETRDFMGRTPLIVAVSLQQDEVVDMLLAAKAAANAEDEHGNSVLAWAAIEGTPSAATKLLDHGAKPDAPNDSHMTPLFHAAHRGEAAIVKILLDRGSAVEPIENSDGDSALMRAANNDHLDVVVLLVDHKAKVNLANREGLTALHMAARNGCLEVVDFLLSRQADLHQKDREGRDTLALAAKNNQREMVAHLRGLLGKTKPKR
jgi:ankyrin repeat protein